MLLLMAVILSCSNTVMAQWIQCGPDNGPVNCLASIGTRLFAGTDGGMFISEDGGDSWSNPMSEVWSSELTSFAVMGTTLFTAGRFGGFARSVNNGNSWTSGGVSTGLPSKAIVALAVQDSWIFAGTLGAGIYRSDNLGDNWIEANTGLPKDTITSFTVISNLLFAGTWGEGLFRSSDYGASWIPVISGLSGDTITALATINTSLFAGTCTGQVFRSDNNGDSWIPVSVGLANNRVTCFTSLSSTIFVGTSDGVYSSTNNGGQWTPVNTGMIYREVRALHTFGGELFTGTGGGVYRSASTGGSWADVSQGMKNAGIRTLVRDGSKFYVGTWIGIFLSDDECNNWESYLEGPAIFSIALTSEDFYAGHWGRLFYTPRSSTNWFSIQYPDSTNRIYSLAARDNTVYVGTESGGLFRTKHYGTFMWESTLVGFKKIPVNCLLLDGETLYAATGTGLFSSINEGGNWTPLNNGLTNLNITTLIIKGTDLFAGTNGSGVFRSTNHGGSWTPVNNGLTSLEILSLAVKDNNLFAGTWNGGVSLSTDNGANWTLISHDFVLDPWHKIPQVIHSLVVDENYIYAGERRTSVWRRPLQEIITSVHLISGDVFSEFRLEQNFPNPFNNSTKIRFSVPHQTRVVLKIFDQSGREVALLLNKEFLPGTYEESFNGKHLSEGLYYYQMQAGGLIKTRKFILLK